MLSFIKPTHTGVALTLAPGNVGRHTTVEGIGFIPGASTAASAALSIMYPATPSFPYETTLIRDVQVEANSNNTIQIFTVGAKLSGLWQSRIQGFAYWGGSSAPPIIGTHGIEVGNSFDVVFEDFRAYAADIGIDQIAYSESTHLVRPDFVGGNFGFKNQIDASGARGTFSGLGIFIRDGEYDVYVACIALNQFHTGFIDNNRIALRADTQGNAGIDLLDTRQIHVGYNSFQMPTISANATGLQVRQKAGYGKQNRIDGFTCFAGQSCMTFGSGTSLNIAINLVSLQPTDLVGDGSYGTGFSDAGTNNFMQGITGSSRVFQVGGFIMAGSRNQSLAQVVDVANAVSLPVLMPAALGSAPLLTVSSSGGSAVPIQIQGSSGGPVALISPQSCSSAVAGELCSNGSGSNTRVK